MYRRYARTAGENEERTDQQVHCQQMRMAERWRQVKADDDDDRQAKLTKAYYLVHSRCFTLGCRTAYMIVCRVTGSAIPLIFIEKHTFVDGHYKTKIKAVKAKGDAYVLEVSGADAVTMDGRASTRGEAAVKTLHGFFYTLTEAGPLLSVVGWSVVVMDKATGDLERGASGWERKAVGVQ
ncbi:hypothetical protein PENSPDRAFT_665647 [Peniophora sp. CONT]|nr:hypothetical protein PENSPDRAFT_665647 [Peniophora sp. CONT]